MAPGVGEGHPPGPTKKALKQRFLKLLPCCGPQALPSVSESKCLSCASGGGARCVCECVRTP
ncbi:Kv channel-interacting protein 2 [Plecturocebus cupreus]